LAVADQAADLEEEEVQGVIYMYKGYLLLAEQHIQL
jgi:hypothetical protein